MAPVSLATLLALVLVACGKSTQTSTASGSATAAETGGGSTGGGGALAVVGALAVAGARKLVAGALDVAGARTVAAGARTVAASTDGGGGASLDPSGPDFTLYSLPECSVVPNGQLSGADGLTLFVALRNSGPGDWSSLVPFTVESDTGLHAQGNTAISTGDATSGMQVDLRPTDYDRTQRFVITADPDNAIIERDESNNSLAITVSLPSRPTAAENVPCTTS